MPDSQKYGLNTKIAVVILKVRQFFFGSREPLEVHLVQPATEMISF